MALGPGTSLKHYRILDTLGTGGMGEVYLAEDTTLHRRVALKVLPAALAADPERRDRFEREAHAVAALNHPNIVTLHSIEEAGGIRFLTMELIDGRSLSDLIPRRGLPLDRLLKIAVPLCEAIGAAHHRGIVHRDLKPANVMVTDDGRVKVLDFGVAKLRDEAPAINGATGLPTHPITGEGRIIGTVAYMSPEQAEGRPLDHRTDIFSLGILLYEMATGERPFKGDTSVSIISSIIKDTPASVTDLNATLPAEFARLVRRCLEKEPTRRVQSALDLRNELDELAGDATTLGGSSGAARVAVTPAAGRRARPLVAAAIAIILAAGAGGLWLWIQNAAVRDLNNRRYLVAPFENRTGDPSLDPVGAIASDLITQGLAQTQVADVAPWSEPPRAPSLADGLHIAIRAGAGTAVTGVYYLQGDQLLVQARITDTKSGRLLYALDPVLGPRNDPATAIEPVRQRVMGFADLREDETLRPEIVSRIPTHDAYREYRAGLNTYAINDEESIRHLERVIELEPGFAISYLTLSSVYNNQGRDALASKALARMPPPDRLTPWERLVGDANRAVRERRLTEGINLLTRARTFFPGSFLVNYQMALSLLYQNRLQEAMAGASMLQPSDAFLREMRASIWPVNIVARAAHLLGDYARELTQADLYRRLVPDDINGPIAEVRGRAALGQLTALDRVIDERLRMPSAAGAAATIMLQAAQELRAHGHRDESLTMARRTVDWLRSRPPGIAALEGVRSDLGRALYVAEDWDGAKKQFTELALETPDSVLYQGSLGAIAARQGNRADALRTSEWLRTLEQPYIYGMHTYWRASIAALVGDRAAAIDLLRDAFAQGRRFDIDIHRDMNLESLRDDPAYQDLLKPKDR